VEFLQSQLSVEQGRRQRSEERTRVLKNLAEKSKVGMPFLVISIIPMAARDDDTAPRTSS
jgi:hypothetical protein